MFDCKFKTTSTSFYRNGKRRKLSDAGERLWHALKDCSDHYGAITGDEDDLLHGLFAGVPGWDATHLRNALYELVNNGLIALYEEDLQPWIQVLKHDENQGPEFLRKRPIRKSPERAGNGSNSRQMTLISEPVGNVPPVSVSVSGNVSGSNLCSNVAGQAKADEQTGLQQVFDHWCSLDWKGKTSRRPKFSDKRKARIRQRIDRDKFTPVDLCNALTGYSLDPFWNGKKDGTAHMELELRLGSIEAVERGLALYEQHRGKRGGGGFRQEGGRV